MRLLSWLVKFAVMAAIAIVMVYYGLEAWIVEDNIRVAKLEQHFYELALNRAPAPPQNVRMQPKELAQPKTQVFQDMSTSTVIEKQNAKRREGVK